MTVSKMCICGNIIARTDTCPCKERQQINSKKYKTDKEIEEEKFLKSTRWKKTRLRVIKRDGGSCQRCLSIYNVIESANLQVHHIKSRKNFPDLRWEEANLVTLCRLCNTQLGTKDKLDFKHTVPSVEEGYCL